MKRNPVVLVGELYAPLPVMSAYKRNNIICLVKVPPHPPTYICYMYLTVTGATLIHLSYGSIGTGGK
jgi:hypothetical protein